MNRLLEYITPDWQIDWDIKQIAEELPGFVFRGPGWYYRDNNWLLISNTDIVDVYTIQAFFDRDPRRGFAALLDAPVRLEIETKKTKKPFKWGFIVLIVGMIFILPLSMFLTHRFGTWGIGMLLIFSLFWGNFARWITHRVEGKKI